MLLYIIFLLGQQCKVYLIRRQASTASTCQLDNDSPAAVTTAAAVIAQKKVANRLCSLDTFRGLAIVTMIFANSGCGKYHWIEHASWNGIHPADFIFPSFLWIMGVCIPFSLKSQFDKNIPRPDILSNILIVSRNSIYTIVVLKHLSIFGFFFCRDPLSCFSLVCSFIRLMVPICMTFV